MIVLIGILMSGVKAYFDLVLNVNSTSGVAAWKVDFVSSAYLLTVNTVGIANDTDKMPVNGGDDLEAKVSKTNGNTVDIGSIEWLRNGVSENSHPFGLGDAITDISYTFNGCFADDELRIEIIEG